MTSPDVPTPRREERTPIALMDTTLRDGEQTPGLAFAASAKLEIAKTLLEQVRVDRIEIASALVSPGERGAAETIATWAASAGRLEQVEALGYCDDDRSASWLQATGIRRVNLLMKGSERHCRQQLGLSPRAHLERARVTRDSARRRQLEVSGVWLEDWSRGMRESPRYVLELVDGLLALGLERFYLADTLGVLGPSDAARLVRDMLERFPSAQFELHAHDDYGLATANCVAAAEVGVHGLHVTVNGLGERAGNADLAEVAVAVRDHTARRSRVREASLCRVSSLVERASGMPLAPGAPVTGKNAFTHTAGVHADGDAKARLYRSQLAAERFGRATRYALGKHSGRASIEHHLESLGIELSADGKRRLLARVVALADDGHRVREEDLPRLVAEIDVGALSPRSTTTAGPRDRMAARHGER